MVFELALVEIHNNHKLLPNITLGFHAIDNFCIQKMTYLSTLQLLTKGGIKNTNYNCDTKNRKVLTIVGGLDTETSIRISNLVSIYKMPLVGTLG